MWIATIAGFYSAVQHRDMPDHVMIRARARQDLDNLRDVCETLGHLDEVTDILELSVDWSQGQPAADYPFRVTMPKSVWVECLDVFGSEIDYDNFKTAVAKVSPARAHTYHRVWAVLLSIEREVAVSPLDDDDDVDDWWGEDELEDFDDGSDYDNREADADRYYTNRTGGPL